MLLYKEEIEAALKTPDFAGFQLLDLHDFPGQGTALVGILDAFWDNKPYSSPEAFREFCNETVLLACFEKLTFAQHERCKLEVKIAHFGKEPLQKQTLLWELHDGSRILKHGTISINHLPQGAGIHIGDFTIDFSDVSPGQLQLHLQLQNTAIHNHWDLWLYPSELETTDVWITHTLDKETIARLSRVNQYYFLPNPIPLKTISLLGLLLLSGMWLGLLGRLHIRLAFCVTHSILLCNISILSIIPTGNGGNWCMVLSVSSRQVICQTDYSSD